MELMLPAVIITWLLITIWTPNKTAETNDDDQGAEKTSDDQEKTEAQEKNDQPETGNDNPSVREDNRDGRAAAGSIAHL
jgi:hypothetical protein